MDTDLPLARKLVVVACSELKADDLRNRFQALGAQVLLFPAIRIRAIQDNPEVREAIGVLHEYHWIIFTSANAVTHFAGLLEKSARGIPPSLQVCAIGPATAAAARSAGFRVDVVPERYVAEGVVEALSGTRNPVGLRILLPRAREARELIPTALRQAGARVDVLPVYETVAGNVAPATLECIREGRVDLFVFTSSSNVSNFVSTMGEEAGRVAMTRAVVAVLGPVTAKTAEDYGKVPEIVPPENTIPSLVSAVAQHWQR